VTPAEKLGRLDMLDAKDTITEAAAVMGRKGGQARAASLTAARRSEIASLAAKARWKKRKKSRAKEKS
jgi:hypothetical protein